MPPTAFGPDIGLDSDMVARGAALALAGFGLVMLLPALSGRFSAATVGIAARADAQIDAASDAGHSGQIPSGALLGAAWSPCIGSTLGAAIALASTGESPGRAGAIMATFALGVSTLIPGLVHGAKSAIRRGQNLLRRMADLAKPVMGMTFIGLGLALWFGLHHAVEGWQVRTLPAWLIDFSISI